MFNSTVIQTIMNISLVLVKMYHSAFPSFTRQFAKTEDLIKKVHQPSYNYIIQALPNFYWNFIRSHNFFCFHHPQCVIYLNQPDSSTKATVSILNWATQFALISCIASFKKFIKITFSSFFNLLLLY